MLSYTTIVSSPPVLQQVIADQHLNLTLPALQSEITATVPQGTVLLDVSVKDRSPQRALDIARSVGVQFPRFVNTLEDSAPSASRGPSNSSVRISVVSPPRLPTSPVSPRKPVLIGLGLFLGLILGLGGVVVREYWDRRIRDPEDVAAVVAAPLIGNIPEDSRAGKRPLVVQADPQSVVAEGYRQLRTNLQFREETHDLRSFVVCSAVPSEGKTVVAANLSLALAQAGLNVILVDADLRLPRLASLFGLENEHGLADALTGQLPIDECLQSHDELPLQIMTSGWQPSNPSELLEQFPAVLADLLSRSDIVIVDSPALLPVTDGSIVAQSVSGAILVARVASTRANQIEAAARSLRLVGAEIAGVVANFTARGSHYGRYGRYGEGPPSTPTPPPTPRPTDAESAGRVHGAEPR